MRKTTAFLLPALIVFAMCAGCGREKQTADVQNGSGPGERQGREEQAALEGNVVHIKTPEDLADFAERVNGGETALGAVLEEDIDLSGICSDSAGSWTPIDGMEGGFDGSGHTISGLYCVQSEKAALFGDVSGTVKDLNLQDVVVESAEGNAAGLALAVTGGGSVENCTVSGSVRGYKDAAGIVVYTSEDVVISDCVNEASVQSGYFNSEKMAHGGYTAGIVSDPWSGTIRGCVNRGEITGSGFAAGGILGGISDSEFCIEDCVNEGTVRNIATTQGLNRYAGGIAGIVNQYTLINRCVNRGDVSSCYYAAGITPRSAYVVINCANHGTVTATTSEGQAYGLADASKGLVNCYNTGDVATERYAMAFGSTNTAMEANLYNYGTVSCVGGGYANLTDGFAWSMGGAPGGLINVWSREGCVAELPEGNGGGIQIGVAAPESVFADGTVLSALNEFAAQLNAGNTAGYEGINTILETFRSDCDAELSAWVAGEDGLPRFEWE